MYDSRHYLSPLFEPAAVCVISEADPGRNPWFASLIDGLRSAFGEVPVHRLPARGARPARRRAESTRRAAGADAAHGGAATPPGGGAGGGDERTGLLAVIRVDDGERVGEAIELAAALGAGAAVALEAPCDAAQRVRWRELARAKGLRLLGPATLGFTRPALGLNAGRLGPLPEAGNVALVSQSGALAASIMDWSAGTLIGFSLVASLGAEADVDLPDVLDFLVNDTRTKSVVLYLEAVHDARKFMSAMRALATVKPVVVLRGGRRAPPGRRVRTHSGAIVGADAIYSAALRRVGAVELQLFTQMFTSARYLASARWPLGRRIAIISNGSGPAMITADQVHFQGLGMGPFSDGTLEALGEQLPRIVPTNPLVLGIDATPAEHERAIAIVAADPAVDGILVVHSPAVGVDSAGVAEAVGAAGASARKPVFTCWPGGAGVMPHRDTLDDAGLPSFSTPESAVDAFATVSAFYQNQLLLQEVARSLSGLQAPDLERARALVADAVARGREVLTEIESKALLDAFHVPLTRTLLAADVDEAVGHAARIGYPAVLKICSPDISHKSEVGGVVLDIRGEADLRQQFAGMLERVRALRPDASIDGISVQRMIQSRDGLEVHVGVVHDAVFGPTIAFGSGGTAIERVRDSTIGFAPLNRFLADRVIARTRIGKEIARRRETWPAAQLAVERILVRVSEMVCELPQVLEMDINPIILDGSGAVAVDARIVLDPRPVERPGSYSHMAILPYPAHLVRMQKLADGQPYELRPIRPEDGNALQHFVRGLSDRSRYFRFISTMSELTPRMLARYTQVDYHRELALLAVLRPQDAAPGGEPPGAERIIGVVRYLLNPDGETCEFAIAIDDAFQGKRLGTQLMQAIIEAARVKGLRRVEGFVLGENRGMLRLMKSVGFRIAMDPEDPTMRRVHYDLE
ncbi:MAG: GNAT family N-acetyltransferase, partial [Burkholderiaceae bacterium]